MSQKELMEMEGNQVQNEVVNDRKNDNNNYNQAHPQKNYGNSMYDDNDDEDLKNK